MQLDDHILAIGDPVYHLIHGAGTVKTTNDAYAVAIFGSMELVISAATIYTSNKLKMIGVEKPLVMWRTTRHNRDVSAYLPIIKLLDSL